MPRNARLQRRPRRTSTDTDAGLSDFSQTFSQERCYWLVTGGIGDTAMQRREFIAGIGAAAAWPLGARAQQPTRLKRIAMVHPSSKVDDLTIDGRYKAFFEELIRLGYVEGKNLAVERYSAEGRTAVSYTHLTLPTKR